MNPFLNRMKKNLNKIRAWSVRQQCDAYRVYDRDIPEYAVSVDYYAGSIVIYRYFNPQFAERDDERFRDVLAGIEELFEIDRTNVFVKERSRQKGNMQYERLGEDSVLQTVTEFGLKFIVNLSDYLDTGLFLDHRLSRYWVQRNSADLRVLNLFCYTGSVSVHAACGGAKRVVSVDLSARYLDWARDNFKANQISTNPHEFVRADVCQWLTCCQESFDLIFVDPPSFSNSKKMSSTFDVQRDHAALLRQCSALLSTRGRLFFSNNLRSFKLDPDITANFTVSDISKITIPQDFKNQLIHKAWIISR